MLELFQPAIGGVPAVVASVGAGLLERGWRVSVAGPACEATAAASAAGADVTLLELRRAPSPLADPRAAWAVARLASERGVELIHAHSSKAGLVGGAAARLAGIPSVYSPHAWSFGMHSAPFARAAYSLAEGALATHVHDAVVVNSESERWMAGEWRVADRERVAVVPNGIADAPPPDDAARAWARARLGLEPGELAVAWVGREGPQKRPGDLIPIARALGAQARVLALGQGLDELAPALAAAGGRVLGQDTPPSLLYAAADVFLQTSAWEGMPIVVLEAMAAALPVVAYRVGGLPEQVADNVSGLLAPPGDHAALAAQLRELAADPQRRRAMGAAGRARFEERFTRELMLDALAGVYREVTTVRAPG